jgi:two-component system phosphate regulon sensor histidine kinase PhoR
MLLNIFDNAIKYNAQEQKTIHICVDQIQAGLSLRISDNGTGMEDEVLQHVFDKFYRGTKPGSAHISGLGLGMYYVQQCIKIHHWKLEVHSVPGSGTELIILI